MSITVNQRKSGNNMPTTHDNDRKKSNVLVGKSIVSAPNRMGMQTLINNQSDNSNTAKNQNSANQ